MYQVASGDNHVIAGRVVSGCVHDARWVLMIIPNRCTCLRFTIVSVPALFMKAKLTLQRLDLDDCCGDYVPT